MHARTGASAGPPTLSPPWSELRASSVTEFSAASYTEDLFVFADPATAARTAQAAHREIIRKLEAQRAGLEAGHPATEAVPSSATPIGRTVVLYAPGLGRLAGSPITGQALATVRKCVDEAGYG